MNKKYGIKTATIAEESLSKLSGGGSGGAIEIPEGATSIPFPMTNSEFHVSGKVTALNSKIKAFYHWDEDKATPSHFPSTKPEKTIVISQPTFGPNDNETGSAVRIAHTADVGWDEGPLSITLTVYATPDQDTYLTDDWSLGGFKEIYFCPDAATFNAIVAKIQEDNPDYISYNFEDIYVEGYNQIKPSEMRGIERGMLYVNDWESVYIESVS